MFSSPPHRAFRLVSLLCLLLVAGCGGGGDDASPAQAAGSGGGSGGGAGGGAGRGAGRAAEPAVPVAVAAAAVGDIASFYDATASLEAEKTALILARVAGTVSSLSAEEGDRVPADGVLLNIGNDEYRYKVEQAAANTANLASRFRRLEAMRQEDLASVEEYQAGLSELESARAEEGLAQLNLSYTTVRAPFAGRVTQRLVDVGQTVAVGTELFELSDFDPLLARVHVPSREFNALRRDQDVTLVLDSDGTRLSGRIKLISPVIDPTSGTIKVTVEVDDYPAHVRPGDFAAVKIVTERREGVVLVPRGAVLTDKGETVVFVPVSDGDAEPTAERRVVEIGFTDDLHAEVVSGLAAGERVVVKGQRSLKHGTPLRILETGEAGDR